MNWLDWLIAALVILSVWAGFREGFIRMGIGFAALIVGFFVASWFHGTAAGELMQFIDSRAIANILGFMLIYLLVVLAGTLLAAIIVRMFKLVGLSFVDRLLGGVFGLIRAAIVIAVATMVIMAFAPKRMPAAVNESRIAPYVLGTAEVFSSATPYEIKRGFEKSYAELRSIFRDLSGPKTKKLPVRDE